MADINDIKNRTVSHGTLNPDHLIPAFCDVLKEYAPDKYAEFIKDYPELDGWEDFLEADWRIISDDTKMNASDELFGLLNDIAPEGTMFSSTEGDGADFGFWSMPNESKKSENALKKLQGRLSQYKGKTTGQIAADVRYDVATALDMAVDKAEDLMSKFGLDKIYELRAKGLSPKAIAKKILKAEESKNERRDNADYLQEVWDALVSVWDKEKFNMDKGYDDEYECEAINIASKYNEGVRAKIYVDDHEGKHPVGFNVIYRYPGDKGVGDLGYYEFQSTDFDETAPEIFAYFDELKGRVKEPSKSEATGVAAIYGDGDVSTHENSADGFYVDEHDPMGFAVLNNDTATMKELFSGKAAAPEKPWTYAGWHEDTDAPENKDGSYPYVYDWEREYDLNFVNDWKRVVGDKNNEKALELLLKYAPDFIPSAMDFWNAFHAGYSKGLLRKLFDNIFAVVDKDDPYNNYLGYGDYTYDEVAKFLGSKNEAADSRRVDDYANMRFFDPEEFVKYVRKAYGKDGGYVSIDSVVPVSVLDKANRMAQKNGYKKMEAKKAISCNALIAALQEKGFDVKEDLNGSYRIVAKGDDFDTTDNLLFITTLYPESTSDRDFVSDSAFVRGRVNGNRIVATDLKSVEDIVSVCVDAFGKKTETKNEDLNTAKDFVEGSWDNTSSESKNESLTLKQKELKDMARYGEAEDITTISDAEAKELKKKGIETVGVSRGTYGMNGALLRDREGNKYVITARSSNLFYFV